MSLYYKALNNRVCELTGQLPSTFKVCTMNQVEILEMLFGEEDTSALSGSRADEGCLVEG